MAFLFQNTPKTAQNITIKKKNDQRATAKSATPVTIISAHIFSATTASIQILPKQSDLRPNSIFRL